MSEHKHKPFIRPAGKISMQDFARLVAAEEFTALDRLGNKIIKGSLVAYRTPFDTIFTVMDIAPVMDPRAPVPMVRLTLSAAFPITCRVNQSEMPLIWCGQMMTPEQEAILSNNGQGETSDPRNATAQAAGGAVDGAPADPTAGAAAAGQPIDGQGAGMEPPPGLVGRLGGGETAGAAGPAISTAEPPAGPRYVKRFPEGGKDDPGDSDR